MVEWNVRNIELTANGPSPHHSSSIGRAPLHTSVKTSTRYFHGGRKLQSRQWSAVSSGRFAGSKSHAFWACNGRATRFIAYPVKLPFFFMRTHPPIADLSLILALVLIASCAEIVRRWRSAVREVWEFYHDFHPVTYIGRVSDSCYSGEAVNPCFVDLLHFDPLVKPRPHDATFVEQHWCSRTSMEIEACSNILQHWRTMVDNGERTSTRFHFCWPTCLDKNPPMFFNESRLV